LENGVDSGGIAGHLFFTHATAATAAMAAQTTMPWHRQLAQSIALGRRRWQRQRGRWQRRRQRRGMASSLACSRGGGGSSKDDSAMALPAVCLISCSLACATVAVAEAVQTTMPWHHQLDCCLGITSLLACSRDGSGGGGGGAYDDALASPALLLTHSRDGGSGGGADDNALALPARSLDCLLVLGRRRWRHR
jgi:hypothetical protein